MDKMKTTVLGIRLNDYQRGKLQTIAEDNRMTEVEAVRVLIDKLIEGRIAIGNGVDLSGLRMVAKKKGVTVQQLIDAVVEQLSGPTE